MVIHFCWPLQNCQTNRQLVWKKSPVRSNHNNICTVLAPFSHCRWRMRPHGDCLLCLCWHVGLPPAWECLPIIINNKFSGLACAASASCSSWSQVCKIGLILEQSGLSTEWDQTREILSFHCFLSCGWRSPMDVWESFSQIRELLPLVASHTSSVSKTLVTSASFFPLFPCL